MNYCEMRLIDADSIKSAKYHDLPYTHIHPVGVDVQAYEMGWNDALDAVADSAPTVDAEPVVRCKDCKWYEIEQLKRDGTDDKRYKPSVCVIGAYAEPRKADWYCADGERREG